MSKIGSLFIFAAGAAFGSFATWKLLKDKYEQIAQDEIDSVKEVFAKKEGSDNEESTLAEESEYNEKPNIIEYAAKLQENGYTNYSDSENKESVHKEDGNAVEKPYVISPDEFGEFGEYDTVSLTYYADRVLADDNDDVIEDVDDIVGTESLTHFGEYEDDSVFVRNDKMKCDFEILLDQRNFSDVRAGNQHPMEE
ncbi:MAG: hypothetical protein NC347_03870 [Clostridium sp.]|nr:hypothetical protein [Clostridium sp.]